MEPPGTAPGSEPSIASAFIAIVPKDSPYIGGAHRLAKGSKINGNADYTNGDLADKEADFLGR